MKSTTAIAFILGLIMLLLVMVAAFVFLFQGRNTLEEQRNTAQMEATALQDSLAQANANMSVALSTRSAVEDALATAVSDAVLLEGQLVESQQEVDDLMAQLSNASDTVTASETSQAPKVAILLPVEGATIPVNGAAEIVIAAADPNGIAVVNVLINDESYQEFNAGDVPLFTQRIEWTPTETGPYKIDVMAVNVNGIASELATVSVDANQITTTGALDLPDAQAALRAEIETAVAEIRGLEPITPVVTTILTPAQLRQRVETDLFEEYTPEEAQNETYVLASFDFLPIDFELRDFLLDLYAEQIAGFYDPETDEFVVVSADETFGAAEQVTHAHEFVHALQDQHYALDMLDNDDLSADESMALRALAEGEATFVQTQYALSGAVDVGELLAEGTNLETPVLDNAPPIFSESLLFPYLTGSEFVTALHEEDGFNAVAYAWTNLPKSTEQIIHPDRFLADDFPQEVELPEFDFGSAWVLADEDVLGEAMLRQYLGQQLNADQVETAATGWGGDRYAVYHSTEPEFDDELIMVLRIVWDTEEDSIEFAALYPNYASRLLDAESIIQENGSECWFSDDESFDLICLFQDGLETLIVRAKTLTTVEYIAREIDAMKNE